MLPIDTTVMNASIAEITAAQFSVIFSGVDLKTQNIAVLNDS
jgi:hypothetical protein